MNDDCPFDGEIPTTAKPAPRPPTIPLQSQSDLDRIIVAPMESLSFKDFIRLKCGRDEFSRMKLVDLKSAVSHPDSLAVAADCPDDPKAEASCLRWILWGLPAEKAVRKIRTDLEVTAKVRLKGKR
jgi:ribonuclease HI